MARDQLTREIAAANRAVADWYRGRASASSFTLSSKLRGFVIEGGALEAALAAGTVKMQMNSEYSLPRYMHAMR